jgi:hypothetical protein
MILNAQGRDHVLLLDRIPHQHDIVGPLISVWIQTNFGPAIHHISPHSIFAIPWFPLRDRSIKISLEHVASPQWTVVIGLVLICDIREPARFSTTVKLNHPPTLGSTKSVPWDGALLLALNNNNSCRMILCGGLMSPC